MSEKKFCDMTPDERRVDLEDRINKFHMLQLPGQPMGMHMGTSYLVNDLWHEFERVSTGADMKFEDNRVYCEIPNIWSHPKKVCLRVEGSEDEHWYEPNESVSALLRKLTAIGATYECLGCKSTFSTPGSAKCCPVCSCTTFA